MKYVGLSVILLINCFIFVIAFVLSTVGHGENYTGYKLIVGIGWIATVHLKSLTLCKKGRNDLGILFASLTIPIAFVVLIIVGYAINLYNSYNPNSSEFKAACQSTGLTFFNKPNKPVRSIAFDWASDSYPPPYTFFKMDDRKNMSYQSGWTMYFRQHQFEFVEKRLDKYEYDGRHANGVGPFIRHPRAGVRHGVPELTADALVTYRRNNELNQKSTSQIQQWQVNVHDRRDGQALAELRFVIDIQNERACGETSTGVMDEKAFILNALNIR